ncbi:MAG TPA: DNA adenine methylase [Arcobacter sp.]|nr:DNA adenine methylase [Arcobacter sp.]
MRYLGSKALLLEEIENIINENVKNAEIFCDIFSGTASVARYFKKDYEVISNDLLYFSYVLQMATIENDKRPSFDKLIESIGCDPYKYFDNETILLSQCLDIPFIYENYTPNPKSERLYFTNTNGIRIDYFRQTIERWRKENILSVQEYYYLLAGLIEAVPFISNIAGTFGAYLKHWDNRTKKTINLIELDVVKNGKNNKVFNMDANILIDKIKGDILYIDPPYNKRQYAPNYHLLETIARYDSPAIYGKTGMRPYSELKSKYCTKTPSVLVAFEELIKRANFKHIVVSYSTEGIMSAKEIEKILKLYGKESTFKLKRIPYRRYKHTADKRKHSLEELLFYIEKED